MKKLLVIALSLGFLSSFGHFYLAKRSYQLQAGEASASRICNIGENFNCDSVLLSPQAHLFGVSLSNFGLSFNLILSSLILFFLFFALSSYWKNILFYLSGVIALSSVVMAVISLINHLFCPICWTLYFLSFLILVSLFFAFKKELSKPLDFLLQNVREKKSYALAGVLFFTSLFLHASFMTNFNLKSLQEELSSSFYDWQYEKVKNLNSDFLLHKGNKTSKIVITEFADFLCPACKRVQPALKQFLTHFNNNIYFQFYAYPLDGTCNSSIQFNRSGLSCRLSQALICANKQNKGWPVHDFIFEKQEDFLESQGNKKKEQALLKKMLTQTNINTQKFTNCMKDPKVLNQVKQSAKAGNKAQIQGTPTFFINGKKVRYYSPKLLILKRIYDHLKNN